MDISGIGEAMIEVLVKQKMLNSVADIYHLTSLQNQILLRKFPSFGEKKITELVNQIELSKKQPLWRLLNALWIPHIWKKTAQDVAEYLALHKVTWLDQMINVCSSDGLADIAGIGEKSLQAIQLFMTNPETLKLLRTLEQEGVQFSAINEKTNPESSSHWTFSLTGTFPIARTDLIQQMQKLSLRRKSDFRDNRYAYLRKTLIQSRKSKKILNFNLWESRNHTKRIPSHNPHKAKRWKTRDYPRRTILKNHSTNTQSGFTCLLHQWTWTISPISIKAPEDLSHRNLNRSSKTEMTSTSLRTSFRSL